MNDDWNLKEYNLKRLSFGGRDTRHSFSVYSSLLSKFRLYHQIHGYCSLYVYFVYVFCIKEEENFSRLYATFYLRFPRQVFVDHVEEYWHLSSVWALPCWEGKGHSSDLWKPSEDAGPLPVADILSSISHYLIFNGVMHCNTVPHKLTSKGCWADRVPLSPFLWWLRQEP